MVEDIDESNPLNRQVGGDHYKGFKIQPVEFIHHNNLPFCLGNVVKYVCRYVVKKDPVDLDKAIHYLELQKLLDARGESDG